MASDGEPASILDREFAELGIRQVREPLERGRVLAVAAPMLAWRPTPGIPSFPYFSRAWSEARGWSLGFKLWVDAFARDEQAWCRAAALASPAMALLAVLPEPTLEEAEVYRVPLQPWPLNRFLSPHSLLTVLLFPEDLRFVVYKDDGDTLVAAGPAAFVAAFFPEGPEAAQASYRDCAEGFGHEVTRRVLLDTAEWYGGPRLVSSDRRS